MKDSKGRRIAKKFYELVKLGKWAEAKEAHKKIVKYMNDNNIPRGMKTVSKDNLRKLFED